MKCSMRERLNGFEHLEHAAFESGNAWDTISTLSNNQIQVAKGPRVLEKGKIPSEEGGRL
jgi:hypothetical protein